MSDLQLERSVLESKERDELFAIAVALGTAPEARTKKADLVSQILQVTGVEPATAKPPSPRRSRARKTAAAAGGEEGASAPVASEQLALVSGNGDGGSQPEAEADGGLPATLAGAGPAPSPGGALTAKRGATVPGKGEGPGPEAEAGNGSAAPGSPVVAAEAMGAAEAVGAAGPRGASEAAPAATASQDGMTADAQGAALPLGAGEAAAGYLRPEGRQRFDLEPGLGNSRRRRRRNRDKGGPRGMEREAPGQVPEVAYTGEPVSCAGLLDLREEGYGFLRTNGYLASSSDVYVPMAMVRRYGLRKGDMVEGAYRPAANNEKYPALVRVDSVCGVSPEEARNRPKFENLTPLFPDEKLRLEIPGDPANVTARIVDLISPIGKGQRGLIVSPPKAGKTTVLKQIAHSIEANNPEVHLMVLLVDERPEEVTDMRRSVKGEVVASTFDRPSDEHTQVAELAIERAKRLVEMGRDVVIVLDGITRLARAYNLAQPATGRIMSGGIDTGALYPPKKFFGSARNIEEGGSLTILATALVETGSRMDEVIFEEFKGTGNMELRLDRKLAERRIYPALDVNASSTRHEELLFERNQLQQVWKLRRVLNALSSDGNAAAGLELLVDKIRSTRSNDQFLADIAKQPAPAI